MTGSAPVMFRCVLKPPPEVLERHFFPNASRRCFEAQAGHVWLPWASESLPDMTRRHFWSYLGRGQMNHIHGFQNPQIKRAQMYFGKITNLTSKGGKFYLLSGHSTIFLWSIPPSFLQKCEVVATNLYQLGCTFWTSVSEIMPINRQNSVVLLQLPITGSDSSFQQVENKHPRFICFADQLDTELLIWAALG